MTKTIRTALLSACLMLGGTFAAAGEGHEKREFSVDKKLEHMTRELALTPDQQAALRPVLEEKKTAMDAGHKGDWQAHREKIRALLNDEQKAKFDAMKKHHKKGGMKHHKKP